MTTWQKANRMDMSERKHIRDQLRASDRVYDTLGTVTSIALLLATIPAAIALPAKAAGIALVAGSMTAMSVISAGMVRRRTNNTIRDGEFVWCDAVCSDITGVSEAPVPHAKTTPFLGTLLGDKNAKTVPYARIVTEDGTSYPTPESPSHFTKGSDIVIVSIGNDGSKYAFTKR